jgi:outer membrane protein OmpA-like peptidoglycan-associated protein
MGSRPEGNYKVTMIGQTNMGRTVRMDTTVHMVLWTPPKDEQAMRYSVLYGFNNTKTIGIYEKYLTEVIIPKIPKNGTVIIHGYTDMIGDDDYNQKLSEERANDVLNILKSGLTREGRKDVEFKVYGFGEDSDLVPFENGTPEERFYNRTVIIDIIPKK